MLTYADAGRHVYGRNNPHQERPYDAPHTQGMKARQGSSTCDLRNREKGMRMTKEIADRGLWLVERLTSVPEGFTFKAL